MPWVLLGKEMAYEIENFMDNKYLKIGIKKRSRFHFGENISKRDCSIICSFGFLSVRPIPMKSDNFNGKYNGT